MSKELWCDDYEYYLIEHQDDGLTEKELEDAAIEYADGYMERLVDKVMR